MENHLEQLALISFAEEKQVLKRKGNSVRRPGLREYNSRLGESSLDYG